MVSQSFISKIKKMLETQQQELMGSSYSAPLEIDMDGDEADEIQGNMLLALNNQLSSRNQLKLRQIQNALKRIDKQSFGQCEECEEDIPEKRLLANPCFLTCVGCAEEAEMKAKHRRKG